MIDELSPELPLHLTNKIKAGLLRVRSKKPHGAPLISCLTSAYDVYAKALKEDGQALTGDLLTEIIPGWVFRWALANRGFPPYFAEHESDVPLGDMKVPVLARADILGRLSNRILHWQAEALEHFANALANPTQNASTKPNPEDPKHVVKRLLLERHLTIAKLAEKAKVSEKTVSRLIAGGNVHPKNRLALADALGCNPDHLVWKLFKARKKPPSKTVHKVAKK